MTIQPPTRRDERELTRRPAGPAALKGGRVAGGKGSSPGLPPGGSHPTLSSGDVRQLEAMFEVEARTHEAAGIPTPEAVQRALATVEAEGWAMLRGDA